MGKYIKTEINYWHLTPACLVVGIFKQMAWAAGCTAVGGVVGGPPGALIGGIAGEQTLKSQLGHQSYVSALSFIFYCQARIFGCIQH